MVRESVPQTNYSELQSWTLWTCAPSTHPKTVFYPLSRSSSPRVVNFLLSGQNVMCTRGFDLQSDLCRQNKALEVNNFVHGCYQALSPVFEERVWGRD